MLPNHELQIIQDCAKTYGVQEIILFGSALRDPQSANDIDLGVSGIAPPSKSESVGARSINSHTSRCAPAWMPAPLRIIGICLSVLLHAP